MLHEGQNTPKRYQWVRLKVLHGDYQFSLDKEWELFDCEKDPLELFNVAEDPAYVEIRATMLSKLTAKMAEIGDEPTH